MVEGMLTQEEIDALLSGTSIDEPAAAAQGGGTTQAAKGGGAGAGGAAGTGELAAPALKVLGERLKGAMASAADVTSTVLGRTITISPISIDVEDEAALKEIIPGDAAAFDFEFSGLVSGPACIVLSRPDAAAMASVLMGGEGDPPQEIDELQLSAATEGIKQFVNGLATALTRESMSDIKIGDVTARQDLEATPPLAGTGKRLLGQYSIEIEGFPEGSLYFVMGTGSAQSLSGMAETKEAPAPTAAGPAGGQAKGQSGGVGVQKVEFPSLLPTLNPDQMKNIDILLDVSMQVTVELGRTSKMIKEVLELGTGSIIELDKLAGEPVDLLVNNKLIARGEVVVIDENFGVRVTDIVSPAERIKGLT